MLWTPEPGRASYAQTELIHTIRRCGLTTGLKLCLDAGDANSYSGSGQSWLDTSGNGYDFFRGATSGSGEASDPTFNGTAGQRTSTNYWSFDGGDYFRYDSANETWMNNLHKDGAKYTLFAAWYLASLSAFQVLCGTFGTNPDNTGAEWRIQTSGQLGLAVYSGSADLDVNDGTAALSVGAWHIAGVSVDENAGANGGFFWADGAQRGSAFNPNYAAPSAGAATRTLEIAAGGGTANSLLSTSRLGMFAAWEGVALTKEQLNALYMATRGRFGV